VNEPGNSQSSGLYHPRHEHDACGVGFIAHMKGEKSHGIVEQGLLILKNLNHRGAVGADPKASDGAGVLIQLPDQFLREEMAKQGVALPRFVAPSGSAEDVTRRYAAIRRLLAPLALEPREVLLSSRYAWRVRLSNGLTLELGRDQLREPVLHRLARFVAAYRQTLGRLDRKLEYVDLRYPRGFALRVPEIAQQQTQPGARRRNGGDKEKV